MHHLAIKRVLFIYFCSVDYLIHASAQKRLIYFIAIKRSTIYYLFIFVKGVLFNVS